MRSFIHLLAASTLFVLAESTIALAQSLGQPDILKLAIGTGNQLSELRQADATVTQLSRNGELRQERPITDDPRLPGRTHERLRQYHDGVPIFGAEVTRQTENGMTVSVFGTLHTSVTLDTSPVLSPELAAQTIERLTEQPPGSATRPRLVVLPIQSQGDDYRLVYESRIFTGTKLMVYFIDAITGDIAWAFDDLKTQQPVLPCEQCAIGQGIGVQADPKKISVTMVGGNFLAYDQLRPADIYTFDMRGDSAKTMAVVAGAVPLFDADLATDTDNQWLDGPSVDAHVGMGWTYDYLYRRFGRQSLNDLNVRLIGLVHPIDRDVVPTTSPELLSLLHLNAFYCGLCGPDGVGLTVFGEGLPPNLRANGQRVDFLAGSLDIVAHELAHGVTDFTSSLLYIDESGALNEAFSDIIAIGVEHYAEPLWQKGVGSADYVIGEDTFVPGGLRSLKTPILFGDPDHYSLRFLGTDDNGGVHTNALIAGHAYYLAIEGGTNRVSGITVTGVGPENREQIEQVFYRAFTLLMTRDSNFKAARAATIQAARDLYGANSQVELAVIQAWTAVGVN